MKTKILLFDLETSALLIRAWDIYETNALEIVEQSHLLCFAYKWLGEKTVHAYALYDFPRYKTNIVHLHPAPIPRTIVILFFRFSGSELAFTTDNF